MPFKLIALSSADPYHPIYDSKINIYGVLMTYYESKDECLHKRQHRIFYGLLSGSHTGGAIPGFVLPILYNHMEDVSDIKAKYEHLIKNLQDAAYILVLPPDQKKTHILNVLEKSNSILLPFGFKEHAMLLKLRFDNGLYAEVYNSGDGLENHKQHPNSDHKFQTCRTYFQKNMHLNTDQFHDFLEDYLRYMTYNVKQTYALFDIRSGWAPIHQDSPFQSAQKAGNCELECAMAFLKNNMAQEDYLYYRIRLIQDVHTQISQICPIALVLPRLEEMLKKRATKSINLLAESLQTASYAPYTRLFDRLSSYSYFQLLDHNTHLLQTLWEASHKLPDDLQVKCLITSITLYLEYDRSVKQVPEEALHKLFIYFQNHTWDTLHETEKKFLTQILDCDSCELNRLALTFFSKNLNILNSENNNTLQKLSTCIQKNYHHDLFIADKDFHSLIATLSYSDHRQISDQAKLILSEIGYTLAINKVLAKNMTFFNAYKILFLDHIARGFSTATDPISRNINNTIVSYDYDHSPLIQNLRRMKGAKWLPALYTYPISAMIKTAYADTDATHVLQQDLLLYYGYLCQKQHYTKANLLRPFIPPLVS